MRRIKEFFILLFPLREGYSYKNMQYMMLVSYYSQPLSELLEQLNENQEQYIQGYMEDGKGEILLPQEDGNL